jgi:hypothetical protein
VDIAGAWASNAAFQSFCTVAQSTPPGPSYAAGLVNEAGFLASFVMAPGRDLDGDGLADENDRDDDGDGLADHDELTGVSFEPLTSSDPLLADTDGDGTSDADEAAAGTNPRDPTQQLRITDITRIAEAVYVTWRARDGKTYELLAAPSVDLLDGATALDTVTASGGAPPWYETPTVSTNSATGQMLFYRVRLKP